MPRLYLIRHGKATAGFHEHLDPGLSTLGLEQAHAVAAELNRLTPIGILSSPYLRARETAAPLERLWKRPLELCEAATEIPATDDLSVRTEWLRRIMETNWTAVDGAPSLWRQQVLKGLLAIAADHVVFTHFLTINVIVGAAIGNDNVVCANPGNASITVIDHDGRDYAMAPDWRD